MSNSGWIWGSNRETRIKSLKDVYNFGSVISPFKRTCSYFSKKKKKNLPCDPEISLLGIHLEKKIFKRYLHSDVQISIIDNCQDVEATRVHQ